MKQSDDAKNKPLNKVHQGWRGMSASVPGPFENQLSL